MDKTGLLEIRQLNVWYTPGNNVLSDFCVDLQPHEVVGLIGLNGAGKTTFIKTLSGILDTYNAGSLLWQGRPLSFRDREFKRNRYTVFSDDAVFSYFTFREYLTYAAASYGRTATDVDSLMAGFHFEAYADTLMGELSTGNIKKACLITAFALKPELLLLDEPVNGLDFQSTEYLYALINGYRAHGTILFSSHILESICLTSDRVLVLEDGRISRTFRGNDIDSASIREVLRYDGNI